MRRRRAPAPPPPDSPAGTITFREEEQLKRLFSDPTKYPQTLKTWIISWLEGSDLTLPISSIVGLRDRLAQASGANLIGGNFNGNTDASGKVLITFPQPVSAINGIAVSKLSSAPADFVCTLNISGWTLSSIEVTVWNVSTNAAYANKGISISWIANVTP